MGKCNHTIVKSVYTHWKWVNIALTAIAYLHNRISTSACVTIVRTEDNRNGQLAVTLYVSFNGSVVDLNTAMAALPTWHSLQPSTSIVGAAPRAQPAQGRQRQWRTWGRPWACMSLSSTALRAWTTSPWGGCSVAWHRCVRSFVPSLPPHRVPLRLSMVFVLQASILAVCCVSLVTAPAGYCVD